MLLAIDCGNTDIVFGIFDGIKLRHHWRVKSFTASNHHHFLVLLLEKLKNLNIPLHRIKHVIFASVVNEASSCFLFLENSLSIPFSAIPSPSLKLPIDIDLPDPSQVGADRIVNAVAGFKLTNSNVIIVDFGTATTFDIVKTVCGKPVCSGGIIAPGINLSVDALSKAASKLPKIDFNQYPESVSIIGKNTRDAMWSGIIWGYVGLIEGIIKKIRTEEGGDFAIIATGGLAGLYLPYCELIKWQEPELTLLGLRQIAKNNGFI